LGLPALMERVPAEWEGQRIACEGAADCRSAVKVGT
jgi:hypothetical protein